MGFCEVNMCYLEKLCFWQTCISTRTCVSVCNTRFLTKYVFPFPIAKHLFLLLTLGMFVFIVFLFIKNVFLFAIHLPKFKYLSIIHFFQTYCVDNGALATPSTLMFLFVCTGINIMTLILYKWKMSPQPASNANNNNNQASQRIERNLLIYATGTFLAHVLVAALIVKIFINFLFYILIFPLTFPVVICNPIRGWTQFWGPFRHISYSQWLLHHMVAKLVLDLG
jgi:hypothetical protein